ncbi:hypothetical protein ACFLW6_04310 [Chloroflexota bacterium]
MGEDPETQNPEQATLTEPGLRELTPPELLDMVYPVIPSGGEFSTNSTKIAIKTWCHRFHYTLH